MRLFLSSSMFGRHGDALTSMAGARARVGIIANALDNLPDFRKDYLQQIVAPLFDAHGFMTEELDLRGYFTDQHSIARDLSDFDILWAIGGNSFLLRHAMELSGFDTIIESLMQRSPIIYGGWSAGAVVAGSDLYGIDHMDDPHPRAGGYPERPSPKFGLGLLEGTLVPHFESNHTEANSANVAVTAIRASGRKAITLRDGEVLIQDGNSWNIRR